MKIAVYNKGYLTEKMLYRLKVCYPEFEVVGSFDLSCEKMDQERTLCFDEVREFADKGLVDALVVPDLDKHVNSVFQSIYDVLQIPVFYASLNKIRQNDKLELKIISRDKPWLSVMEYHVTDICNMNCKGCGHCANIIQEPGFPETGEYEKSLIRLVELFDGIGLIRLLGGEPLLNPELIEFLRLSRKYFPFSNLHIVTNGILLNEMTDELIRFIREESVMIDISLYPPMHNQEEIIREHLKSRDLLFNIERIEYFYRRFTPCGGNDAQTSFENCESSKNHLMYKGKIASCAMPFSIDILNKEYRYGITHDAWIDLFDVSMDGWEINRRLDEASSLCSYCSAGLEKFRWSKGDRQKAIESDWIYKG